MKIKGKEYQFKYTVRARLEIAKALPEGSISELSKVLGGKNDAKAIELIQTMALAMNRAFLMKQADEDGKQYDEADLIDPDWILDMEITEEQQLEDELLAAFLEGNKTLIETEAPTGKKTKNQKKPT